MAEDGAKVERINRSQCIQINTTNLADMVSHGVSGVQSAVAAAGHSTSAVIGKRVYEGAEADAALAAGDDSRDSPVDVLLGNKQSHVSKEIRRGVRCKHLVKKTKVTVMAAVGHGKFEVIDEEGNRWVAKEKNLRPL